MRNRSMAMVLRGRKILMVETFRFNRYIFELPGGGIEAGETPEEAAIRELKEESGLDGTVIRPLNTLIVKMEAWNMSSWWMFRKIRKQS